jgi:hypothetical protein
MKTTITTLLIIAALSSASSFGQITQVEFASGDSKTDFTFFSTKSLGKRDRFMLSNLAFFQKFHQVENFDFDEVGVQTTTFWNFSKHFSIGPSLYFNSAIGFTERVSFLGRIIQRQLFVSVIPTVFHSQRNNSMNGELFIQIQYSKKIKKSWSYVLNASLLSSWDRFSVHGRSFQQIRTGVSYNNTQFGLAMDFDQYGPKPITQNMIGLFLKHSFYDK